MAATLTSQEIFDSFIGEFEEQKTFYHGHTYTGNPLSASCALASIDGLVKSQNRVTPAKAGVHNYLKSLDSCFRRNDKQEQIGLFTSPSVLMHS